ncbi:ribonuclease catalytic domain-containing protein [Bordetella avium]|uniref:ribonuclease catalytic domain-containing protein n=1 Tax=Bordetella avium TaxID=521 RepID=UPI000E09EEE2|nr:ribonuclease catalytic domain-containing protein [Bordetella avium]RIQ15643.1 RNB domain-containing ribonuclease [Bordetella avium]RIQ38404.1 RNB domain-containing ribonuclease [Bordetella avium]RIQ43345.1 RNB domain-containing ribonuclease [Bordetella avium]RIQ44124.1 RNB domain-containing ribonuclease [Bordetella avium]RIQ52962.1 RNB domain-containing ribonuclease [Bordetella avium]
MYVFYEDDGSFKAGKILSEADASLQVESESGKRSKIKRANTLFTFASPEPVALMRDAAALAEGIDLAFLWECAPQEEFDAPVLAADYFGHAPNAVEQAALLMRLHGAPVYFHRRGKGHYRPAPPDILQAALAALEKKQRQAEQQDAWVEEMAQGRLPEAIGQMAESLLVRPDKNTMQWKALDAACTRLQKSPDRLLLELGAWPHALALHKQRFLAVNFPRGVAFPEVEIPPLERELPLADAEIYSIDDITTTEIDDALSVTPMADGKVRVGIHVAAPGLSVTRGGELDKLARQRLSTVYMPGDKIPMQPDSVIQAFSLDAGRAVPALSLYVTADPITGEIIASETRIERIVVRENLRHNQLDTEITEAALADPDAPLPYAHWLRPLWQLAQALSAQREVIRGKPENNSRVEYSFYLDGSPDDPDTPVRLVPRQRNAPLDRMVAEFMILANNLWGGLLHQHGVPGIYRSQQAGRVRMSTQALPHEAIGVPQYAWSTSPLRRYVDLVNQWQLIAAVEHGVSARLVAPFKPKDADLFAIIGAFDAQYATWADFQNAMERYWCMRWLRQQNITRCVAHVLREDLVRLGNAPFVTRVGGMPELERGAAVEIDILGMDELSLELDCRYLGLANA